MEEDLKTQEEKKNKFVVDEESPKQITFWNEKSLVVKSNPLLQARYSWPLNAQKIFLLMASSISSLHGENDNEWRISVGSLAKELGVKGLPATYLKQIANIMFASPFEVQEVDAKGQCIRWEIRSIFEAANYNKGVLSFTLTTYARSQLTNLQRNYGKFYLKHIISMKSQYAVRLYELIMSEIWKKSQKKKTYGLLDLRKRLGVEEGKYERFSNFEKKVIIPAVEEINEKTDLNVKYGKKKVGYKIEFIDIYYEYKPQYVEDFENIYISELGNFKIDKIRTIAGIRELWDYDAMLELYREAVKVLKEKKSASDLVGSSMGDKQEDLVYYYMAYNYEYAKRRADNNLFAYYKQALAGDYANALLTIMRNFSDPIPGELIQKEDL